ncbi:hypothetical protein BS47DRAFT_1397603 [Hydnum rufescens UP504]|uniref:Uncharacterized protein n=1 Tax=Hydnum rufescens UP504 TaxID=1448309 RepID=A0A9P6AMP8_9AGAM|nr:hypothetical protein BS47DRAFT_1397603 [Hydnum rufescens UP504]
MQVEEHSQGDAEAPSHEEEAQILPPENDHHAEDACQSAEENPSPRERGEPSTYGRGPSTYGRGEPSTYGRGEYQSMDEGNQENRSADKDAPVARIGTQNVSEVGDEEMIIMMTQPTKPQMSSRKWWWMINALAHPNSHITRFTGSRPHTPEYSPITPRDLTPAPRYHPIIDLLLRLMSFLLGRFRGYICARLKVTPPSPSCP